MKSESWEQQAVSEIITEEIAEAERKLTYYESLVFEQSAFGYIDGWLEDAIDDLQEELEYLHQEQEELECLYEQR